MVDLDSTNAHQDSQDFRVSRLEGERRIQARSALLDKRKVKPRRVGNRLHAGFLRGGRGNRLSLVRRCVGVIQWYGGLVLNGERSLELHSEIRVLCAAVPRIPTKVDVELQQVCQPFAIFGAGSLTTGQGPKRIQNDGRFPLGDQVGIEEGGVTQFIVGIVGNVLRHIAIKVAERGQVGRIASLDSPQFVVLLPEISLDEFYCRREPQERSIALGKRACAPRLRVALGP